MQPAHAFFLTIAVALAARAQHEHPPPGEAAPTTDRSVAREGSGTAWQPDTTRVPALHGRLGRWTVMFHGSLHAGYDVQGGPRGARQWVIPSWAMLSLERGEGRARLAARAMASLDPLLIGAQGYPLLLQTGETFRGEPLVDRQHPHDLLMEASLRLALALSPDVAIELYGGPAGEPALGPVAYPHRQSAAPNPLAPLGHHWQDSSHITYGVLTAGLVVGDVKLEGSWFNGVEPDEDRFAPDFGALDSYSIRLAANPAAALSLQASYGFLRSPEALRPGAPVHRITASALLTRHLGDDGSWASALVWGRNVEGQAATDAWLVETSLEPDRRNTLFARLELARKDGHDLRLPSPLEESTWTLASLSAGYLRGLGPLGPVEPSLGAVLSVNAVPSGLAPVYGSPFPLGAVVFARLRAGPDA